MSGQLNGVTRKPKRWLNTRKVYSSRACVGWRWRPAPAVPQNSATLPHGCTTAWGGVLRGAQAEAEGSLWRTAGRPSLEGDEPHCPPRPGHTSLTWPFLTAEKHGRCLAVPGARGRGLGTSIHSGPSVSPASSIPLQRERPRWPSAICQIPGVLGSLCQDPTAGTCRKSPRQPREASGRRGRPTGRPGGLQSGELSPATGHHATPVLRCPAPSRHRPLRGTSPYPGLRQMSATAQTRGTHGPFQKDFHFKPVPKVAA